MNNLLNISRILILIIVGLSISSCNKQYTCTCKTSISKQDTILDIVETTKLGSKGFNKTCKDHETSNMNLKECRIY
jgi:hypothetical protein